MGPFFESTSIFILPVTILFRRTGLTIQIENDIHFFSFLCFIKIKVWETFNFKLS